MNEEELKKLKQITHSAIVKSKWYALHPEVIIPDLLLLAVKTTTVVAVVKLLAGI